MQKAQVIEFFGDQKVTAYALDLTSGAVRMWPDELGANLTARVILAGIQWKGVTVTREAWPDLFRRRNVL